MLIFGKHTAKNAINQVIIIFFLRMEMEHSFSFLFSFRFNPFEGMMILPIPE